VRLLDPVVESPGALGAPVRALVIAPATDGGRAGLVPGDTLTGVVRDAGVARETGRRHFLTLAFERATTAGAAAPLRLAARVVDVPNARESVDTAGRIVGPVRRGVGRSRADWAPLLLLAARPVTAAVLLAALTVERAERHRRIAYAPGVEMTLALTSALPVPARPVTSLPPAPDAVADALAGAPLRVATLKERLPADIFTIAIVGSAAAVANAFAAAGWTAPARSKLRGDLATLAAAARARGFAAQPFTVLQLDGRPPTFAFEKVVNSMSKRRHLRIWPWGTVDGRPLWLVAATRDVGLRFSRARHAFTHRIDPDVDAERDKVVDDLVATGAVTARSMVARAAPPGLTLVNDGTTPAKTDWRLAALVLGDR
jgi:hypothetical protein